MTAAPINLTPADLVATNAAYWADLRGIKLQAGPFSFKDHEYQMEPMCSGAKRKCYMKGTQLGVTEMEVLSTLHGMIYGHYPLGVLYMFPTTDNVQDFSRSRFGPLIDANKETIGQYVKMGGKGTDTTGLKKVRDAFLYLRGARLTQSVGVGMDEKESVQLRSIPVDRVVFDEMDLMDDDVVMKARGRMGASKVGEEVFLSNPTLPGVGIDAMFQKSDQRHWFRKCGCGHWTCPELTFPDCVVELPGGRGFIRCMKCGKPLPRVPNEWVPTKPDNKELVGYRMSHLMSVTIDPSEVLRDFRDPPQGNMGDVYRLRLGLPYVAAEDRLQRNAVLDCCGSRVMPAVYGGPCAMGVDVGKTKHVVIGVRTGTDSYEIVKVMRLTDWTDLNWLAHQYNVKSAVIDCRPYEDEARAYQKGAGFRVFLCEYAENTALGVQYNDNTGLVKVNRTEIFDRTHRLIEGKNVVLPRRCSEVEEFADQCCATAKVLETNKRTGTAIYRYRKLGDEHYRNALNYFVLAASGSMLARITIGIRVRETAQAEYDLVT